jgi:hypothetical protein
MSRFGNISRIWNRSLIARFQQHIKAGTPFGECRPLKHLTNRAVIVAAHGLTLALPAPPAGSCRQRRRPHAQRAPSPPAGCRGRSNRQRPRPAGSRRCRRHSQAHTANAIARADVRALALPALSTSGNCPQSVSACAALPARTTRVHTAGARAASVPARRQRSRRLMPRASCAPGRAPRRCPTRPCHRLAPWTVCRRRRP